MKWLLTNSPQKINKGKREAEAEAKTDPKNIDQNAHLHVTVVIVIVNTATDPDLDPNLRIDQDLKKVWVISAVECENLMKSNLIRQIQAKRR